MDLARKDLEATETDPWLSIYQAADALGISRPTVLSLVARGLLVVQQVAGRVFVHRDSVARYLEAKRREAAAASSAHASA